MNLALILDLLRRLRYAIDPAAEPSMAQKLAPMWEADRRERQHARFVIDRADLFEHGIGDRLRA